jgi:phospholipase/carboxylesterase
MSTTLHRAGPRDASRAAILLHGRGAGAEDILGLGVALAPPDTAFFAPEAVGRSWWPTSFLAPMGDLRRSLDNALEALDDAFEAAHAAGYVDSSITLLGFSQGACLALEYAARSGRSVRAVCGLSGGLVGTEDAEGAPSPELFGYRPKRFTYGARLDGVPFYLGCHAEDPHIPLARVRQTERVLTGMGATCRVEIHPGYGHGVTPVDAEAARTLMALASRG